ncbi:hypothetical protein DOY81_007535 [Sarcophaga bullata]|nr:hypothetical protein DOY81_007535 [Sarcophaga bullata]
MSSKILEQNSVDFLNHSKSLTHLKPKLPAELSAVFCERAAQR